MEYVCSANLLFTSLDRAFHPYVFWRTDVFANTCQIEVLEDDF